MSTSSQQYTYCVFQSGNNVESITTALRRLPNWKAVDEKVLAMQNEWVVNFVWKPTWSQLRPPPASQQWARGHVLPGKRAVVSHWKAVEPLCEKPDFFTTLREYYEATGRDYTEILPQTFIIQPRAGAEAEKWAGWGEWSEACRSAASQNLMLWLCKPADENRGIGIEVCRSEAEVRDFLASKGRGAALGVKTHWVVQKYLERPLLTPDSRKFDLRVWCVLLDTGDTFLYAPGYVRTSSDAYDPKDSSRFAHLTNYCQQVNSSSFGSHEEGNTERWETLESWLLASSSITTPATMCGAELLWGRGDLGVWGQIRSAVMDALGALRLRGGTRSGGFTENGISRNRPPSHLLSSSNTGGGGGGGGGCGGGGGGGGASGGGIAGSQHRFELLGLDFLLNSDLSVKFIEVNTNPSLDHQAKWHGVFVDVMVDRLLAIVLRTTHPEISLPKPLDGPETNWTLTGNAAIDDAAARFRPPHGWQFLANAYTDVTLIEKEKEILALVEKGKKGGKVMVISNHSATVAAALPGVRNTSTTATTATTTATTATTVSLPSSPSRPSWRAHGPKAVTTVGVEDRNSIALSDVSSATSSTLLPSSSSLLRGRIATTTAATTATNLPSPPRTIRVIPRINISLVKIATV